MFDYYIWPVSLYCSVSSTGEIPEWSSLEYPQQVTVYAHTIYRLFQYYNGYRFSSVYIVQLDYVCFYTHFGQE